MLLVNAYSGLGIHTLLILLKTFPGQFKQVYFASVGVLDSGNFKGVEEVAKLRADRQQTLDKFILLAARSASRPTASTRSAPTPWPNRRISACASARKFPRSVFFAGKLLFEAEKWYYPLLHNETAYAITRRLQLQGIPTVVMPIRKDRVYKPALSRSIYRRSPNAMSWPSTSCTPNSRQPYGWSHGP